jgi:ribosome-binding factor A
MGFVTVLKVEVTPDLKEATIYISIFGSSADRSKAFRALEDARGYVQKEVGKNLETRNTPRLKFILEESQDKVSRIEALIGFSSTEDREDTMAKKPVKKDDKALDKPSKSARKPSRPAKKGCGKACGGKKDVEEKEPRATKSLKPESPPRPAKKLRVDFAEDGEKEFATEDVGEEEKDFVDEFDQEEEEEIEDDDLDVDEEGADEESEEEEEEEDF